MKPDDELKKALQAPFEEEDIEWRVQMAGISKENSPYAKVVPYITNRAIQKRLDDLFGIWGWEDAFKQAQPTTTIKNNKPVNVYGWLCGITIHGEKRSVTKWDGAEETQIEPFKGGLSGSEKRTGSKLGIGRYLYRLKPVWAICQISPSFKGCPDNGHTVRGYGGEPDRYINWETPPLPKWALPGIDFSEFLEPVKTAKDLKELRIVYQNAYRQAETTGNDDNVEAAIAAKDVKKVELIQQLKDEKDKNLKIVVDWIDKQSEIFQQIPNQSGVENVYLNNMQPSLQEKIKALDLEAKPLNEMLDIIYKARIKQLEPKKDVKNEYRNKTV